MAHWEWDASLSIGIDIIDKQHKRIIDYINKLDSVMTEKDFDKLTGVVNELVDYTITHFTFEEDMLEKANYSFISSHKKVHKAFTDRIASYQQRLKDGEDISNELMGELKVWLTNHIKIDDKDYASAVSKVVNKKGWFKSALSKFFG